MKILTMALLILFSSNSFANSSYSFLDHTFDKNQISEKIKEQVLDKRNKMRPQFGMLSTNIELDWPQKFFLTIGPISNQKQLIEFKGPNEKQCKIEMKTTSDNFIGHLEIKITDTALKFNEKDPKAYECLLKFAEVFKENDQISVEQRFLIFNDQNDSENCSEECKITDLGRENSKIGFTHSEYENDDSLKSTQE